MICPIGTIAPYFKHLNVGKIAHAFNEHSQEPIVNPTCVTIVTIEVKTKSRVIALSNNVVQIKGILDMLKTVSNTSV